MQKNIEIRGARVHNLRNPEKVKVGIPRNKLVVITGVSGSGKSSRAFDTLYAEGHHRRLEWHLCRPLRLRLCLHF